MSSLFKATLIISIFFGVNKLFAIVRQTLIAREFGFSSEIDAFNVANNIPDLVFSLFSGGALALAFIPVFATYLTKHGHIISWKLFSKTATLLFLLTSVVSIITAIFAPFLVSWEFGIAPGFSPEQQQLVVNLLRINLIATLIFSLSGLVMASLQAFKHFLLPAIAPILYNVGIIFGALILAPASGYTFAGITFPAMNMGIYGLAYGVVIGALMHLLIQIPGMLHFKFRYSISLNLIDDGVMKVLRLMGPRLLTVFLIQITFLSRDNLASRLSEGSVTALTYGHFIMQVPETLIGTTIATALLPTLSEFISEQKRDEFTKALNNTFKVIIAASLITTLLAAFSLYPAIELVFNFSPEQTKLLVWTTMGFMVGLLGHTLLEVTVRAFYSQHDAKTPLFATFVRTVLFIILGVLFFQQAGAVGLATIDSITVTIEVIILSIVLYKAFPKIFDLKDTLLRSSLGLLLSGILAFIVTYYLQLPAFVELVSTLLLGSAIYLFFVRKELKLLVKL